MKSISFFTPCLVDFVRAVHVSTHERWRTEGEGTTTRPRYRSLDGRQIDSGPHHQMDCSLRVSPGWGSTRRLPERRPLHCWIPKSLVHPSNFCLPPPVMVSKPDSVQNKSTRQTDNLSWGVSSPDVIAGMGKTKQLLVPTECSVLHSMSARMLRYVVDISPFLDGFCRSSIHVGKRGTENNGRAYYHPITLRWLWQIGSTAQHQTDCSPRVSSGLDSTWRLPER